MRWENLIIGPMGNRALADKVAALGEQGFELVSVGYDETGYPVSAALKRLVETGERNQVVEARKEGRLGPFRVERTKG